MKKIPQEHIDLVTERIEKIKKNPERLLDWKEASKTLNDDFIPKKFNGVLKANEDALVIQKRIRGEWK